MREDISSLKVKIEERRMKEKEIKRKKKKGK
jgi:hypothetical protein